MSARGEMRHDELNTAVLEPRPERVTVVAAIGNDPRGLLLRAPGAAAGDGYLGERRFRELDLRDVGRRNVHSERIP